MIYFYIKEPLYFPVPIQRNKAKKDAYYGEYEEGLDVFGHRPGGLDLGGQL